MVEKPTYEKLEKRVHELEEKNLASRSTGRSINKDQVIINGIASDITKYTQAEKSLKESTRLNKLLLDSLPHPAMLINKKRIVLAANKIARDIGVEIGEFCWKTFRRCDCICEEHKQRLNDDPDCPKDDILCTFCLANELMETGTIQNAPKVSALGRLWDTWWIPVEEDIFLHYAIDITERRQVEDALKYSRLQLEAVHNNIDSSIYITDVKSNKILFMNNHMKELFGRDLTGNICWESIHENQDGPCEFCTNDKLIDADGNPTEPYIWEFYNQKLKKWYELHDLMVPWLDGNLVRMEIATDITGRKQNEQDLNKINEILEDKVKERTTELEDLNAALRVMLKKREEDKKEIEKKISINYESLILPFLQKLKNTLTKKDQQNLMNIVEYNLRELFEPFSKKIFDPLIKLTPTEIQIATMVKQGLSNKEIAQTLNNSVRTISNHRDHIRKKLGLINKKINLQSFLSAL